MTTQGILTNAIEISTTNAWELATFSMFNNKSQKFQVEKCSSGVPRIYTVTSSGGIYTNPLQEKSSLTWDTDTPSTVWWSNDFTQGYKLITGNSMNIKDIKVFDVTRFSVYTNPTVVNGTLYAFDFNTKAFYYSPLINGGTLDKTSKKISVPVFPDTYEIANISVDEQCVYIYVIKNTNYVTGDIVNSLYFTKNDGSSTWNEYEIINNKYDYAYKLESRSGTAFIVLNYAANIYAPLQIAPYHTPYATNGTTTSMNLDGFPRWGLGGQYTNPYFGQIVYYPYTIATKYGSDTFRVDVNGVYYIYGSDNQIWIGNSTLTQTLLSNCPKIAIQTQYNTIGPFESSTHTAKPWDVSVVNGKTYLFVQKYDVIYIYQIPESFLNTVVSSYESPSIEKYKTYEVNIWFVLVLLIISFILVKRS